MQRKFYTLVGRPSIDAAEVRMFCADLIIKAYQSRDNNLGIGAATNRFLGHAVGARVRHWLSGDVIGSSSPCSVKWKDDHCLRCLCIVNS